MKRYFSRVVTMAAILMRTFVIGMLIAFMSLVGMISATDVSIEGHTFALDMPDGWTVDNADTMSVPAYLGDMASDDYTGTYVKDAFSLGDGTTSVSVAIVDVHNAASGKGIDDLLNCLNCEMMDMPLDASRKYIDFDGKKAFLVEDEMTYGGDGSASALSMTVALGKNAYAYVYGYLRDNEKAWDIVKGMTIT
jgi:hypothetical protein